MFLDLWYWQDLLHDALRHPYLPTHLHLFNTLGPGSVVPNFRALLVRWWTALMRDEPCNSPPLSFTTCDTSASICSTVSSQLRSWRASSICFLLCARKCAPGECPKKPREKSCVLSPIYSLISVKKCIHTCQGESKLSSSHLPIARFSC